MVSVVSLCGRSSKSTVVVEPIEGDLQCLLMSINQDAAAHGYGVKEAFDLLATL